jgi:DNA modification methylase
MQAEGPRAVIYVGDSRAMAAVGDEAVELIVTSPPYWHIKDYGCPGQIGYGQSLHEYLADLHCVWRECFRAVRRGGRLCINVGDQFARSSVYGRYRVIPLHAEIIRQCELSGFDSLGSIIWRKKTTMNTSGGAVVMGSFPFPPNGIVELDYEFILLFRKPGPPRAVSRSLKQASALSTEEWKTWFSGHWSFGGARKRHGHEAEFPEELPRRLIRMFSFVGDTVLDPFLGRGTTARVAVELGRNAVGYEINEAYARAARDRVADAGARDRTGGGGPRGGRDVLLAPAPPATPAPRDPAYRPGIADARPPSPDAGDGRAPALFIVRGVTDGGLVLDSGRRVRLRGVKILDAEAAMAYLAARVVGRKVFLTDELSASARECSAYVYLKNRIFVNAHLLKAGMACPDGSSHRLAARFARLTSRPGERA